MEYHGYLSYRSEQQYAEKARLFRPRRLCCNNIPPRSDNRRAHPFRRVMRAVATGAVVLARPSNGFTVCMDLSGHAGCATPMVHQRKCLHRSRTVALHACTAETNEDETGATAGVQWGNTASIETITASAPDEGDFYVQESRSIANDNGYEGAFNGRGPTPQRDAELTRTGEMVNVSIESIAAALESGQRQSVDRWGVPGGRGRERQEPRRLEKDRRERRKHNALNAAKEEVKSGADGEISPRETESVNEQSIDKDASGKSVGPPNRMSVRKRRARKASQIPNNKTYQDAVARNLKARSAEGTLQAFNEAVAIGATLPANLLAGVLNQCAQAGWMDDCVRVCSEMKVRGMVIEENTYVPLIRGLVNHGDCRGALDLIKDMVTQGVQPRLRCYEPVLSGMCEKGDMEGARQTWRHMEEQQVAPREDQYVTFLKGLGMVGEFWQEAKSGRIDQLLLDMSYRARNISVEQAITLETVVNGYHQNSSDVMAGSAKPDSPLATLFQIVDAPEEEDDEGTSCVADGELDPLESEPRADGIDEQMDARISEATPRSSRISGVTRATLSCPACGGNLKAVGLTSDERARIRNALFGLAGLQVKKHSKSRWAKKLNRMRDDHAAKNGFYSFTEEDQKEQLQIFVDWLQVQRAAGRTFTAVIDSANVAYHKSTPWHFSLPQVDLVVQALEAKGERPLVVIAEKYVDRIYEDVTCPSPGKFRYMQTPLNEAIVKRWRSKSQIFECSDEASDDWYWMYAAVAFDDVPMTVISNDRTRDHRLSLAEPVPFVRWRTTQLAMFDLARGLLHIGREGKLDADGWPLEKPAVTIDTPPTYTRDIQQSDEGCWHLPAGNGDDWLCLDIPRGLQLQLDKLPLSRRSDAAVRSTDDQRSGEDRATADAESASNTESRIREVSGMLQTMPIKVVPRRTSQRGVPDTVVAAAARAKEGVKSAVSSQGTVRDDQSSSRYLEGNGSESEHADGRPRDLRTSGRYFAQPPPPAQIPQSHPYRDQARNPNRHDSAIEVSAHGDILEKASSAQRVRADHSSVGLTERELTLQEEALSAMTVVELKDKLRARGLKVSGRKAILIERLMQQ